MNFNATAKASKSNAFNIIVSNSHELRELEIECANIEKDITTYINLNVVDTLLGILELDK